MVNDPIHRKHQTMGNLQRNIDFIDYNSRLIKRMDLELALLESRQSVKARRPLMPNPRRNLANCCDAFKSTGPRSTAGKRTGSQNSRKHGLNSASDSESTLEYQALVDLIAKEGFSVFVCADIAAGLLN